MRHSSRARTRGGKRPASLARSISHSGCGIAADDGGGEQHGVISDCEGDRLQASDAEVGALDLRPRQQLLRRAFGDDAPFLEHVGAAASHAIAIATFCSTSSTAMPSALMRRMAANMSCTMQRRRGRARARRAAAAAAAPSARGAIATICCWPPESSPAGLVELLARAPETARAPRRATRAAAPWPPAGSCRARGSRARVMPVKRRRPSGTMRDARLAEAVRRQRA